MNNTTAPNPDALERLRSYQRGLAMIPGPRVSDYAEIDEIVADLEAERREHETQVERLHNGSVPDGLEVDHLCKNPTCVRAKALSGIPRSAIAAEYAVALTTVAAIIQRRTWKHV